jgi:cytochrome oxidase assembly protein ShyY1
MSGPRRWLGYVALVVVVAAVCGVLSWWQFSRNEEAQERIRQVAENWDAAPAAITDVLAAPGAAFDPRATWTPVRLTGEYDTANQLLVRGRTNNGRAGFEVLVPLVLADGGGVVIIDRGWLPAGQTQAVTPDAVPAAPAGEVTVIARLRAGEPGIAGRSAPAGQGATIELARIATQTGHPDLFTGAYGILASEDPAADTGTLTVKPAPDPGPFLSYAVQWILFAVFAAIALIWSIRNERRVRKDGTPPPKRRRVGEADAAEEDALLDA